MRIPGANLYRIASRMIRPQLTEYYMYLGRFPDKQRNLVSTYAPAARVMASVQAVPREKYGEMGLEFQKNYVKIYVDRDVIDLDRDAGGDMFVFGKSRKKYKLEDETTWFEQDGWVSCLAVQVQQSFPITIQEQLGENNA